MSSSSVEDISPVVREYGELLAQQLPDARRYLFPPYVLSRPLSKAVSRSHFSSRVLQAIADDMSKYLELSRPVRVVAIPVPGATYYGGPTQAGNWSIGTDGNDEVTLWIPAHPTTAQTVACLAHEITHAYLHGHGTWISDARENETFTETAAVYLGFGQLLLQGYSKQVVERSGYSISSSVGYVTTAAVRCMMSTLPETGGCRYAKTMYCEPPVTPTKNVPRVPAAPVPEYRAPRMVKVRPPMALWKQLIIVGVLGIAAYFILTALAVLQSAR